jgi:hypothetical protein
MPTRSKLPASSQTEFGRRASGEKKNDMIRMLNSPVVRTVLCPAAFLALSATGLMADIFVPATSDIWLAGQPNGSSVTGYFGSDFAPANSPVAVAAMGGMDFNFSITGYTPVSVDGFCFDSTADGGACYADEFGFSPGPANGISLAHLPAGALVGVFVAAGGPSGPTPPALDFTASGIGTSFLSLNPALDQQFFIGDGLTGTGSGGVQQFYAPAGSAELYLAVADSVGASTGNLGGITVEVNGAAAPEPAYCGLLATSFGGMIFILRRRRK